MIKYPRTFHIQGSKRQPDDLEEVSFDELKGKILVIEEKVDGANCGISFEGSNLLLQSRGHYLTGHDHPQWDLFKSWAYTIRDSLFSLLGSRFIMYGEWLYAKHTEFYDALPHYFLEFDILDRTTGLFLSTGERHRILGGTQIVSVPVLHEGVLSNFQDLLSYVGKSQFKTNDMLNRLMTAIQQSGVSSEQVLSETDDSLLMEGIYIKDETPGHVVGRYKWVRREFLQQILDSESHWMKRNLVQNCVKEGVDIFK